MGRTQKEVAAAGRPLSELAGVAQVDGGVSVPFSVPSLGEFNGRLTTVNLFDKGYEIRDGTGVGVGAPQCGPGTAFSFSIWRWRSRSTYGATM